MRQIPLYVDSHKRYFYVTDEDVLCDGCGVELTDVVFIRCMWSKNSQLGIMCPNCAKSPSFDAQIQEWKYAVITYSKKIDFTPVLIMFPGVKNGERDLTVYDSNLIKSDKTKDKTRYAGQSWEGAKLVNTIDVSLLDAPLKSDCDILEVVDKITNAELVFPEYEDVKKLEEGK